MKLYQIKFSGETHIYEDGEKQQAELTADFFLGAEDMTQALMEAYKYFENNIETNDELQNPEIIEVIDTGVWIVNWEHYKKRTFEVNSETAPEDIMKFKCSCGFEILIEEGWDKIDCPSCDKTIDRNHVLGDKGKFYLIDI